MRDPETIPELGGSQPGVLAFALFRQRAGLGHNQVNVPSPVTDQEGRVYFTAQSRPPNDIPGYCSKYSPLRSAQL